MCLLYLFPSETSFYSWLFWEYGWHDLCIHGASQLPSFCCLLRVAGNLSSSKVVSSFSILKMKHLLLGPCSHVLCHLLLPRRISWTQISVFNSHFFCAQMLWEVTHFVYNFHSFLPCKVGFNITTAEENVQL